MIKGDLRVQIKINKAGKTESACSNCQSIYKQMEHTIILIVMIIQIIKH